MRAELYRPDAPDATVAVATWSGGRASIQAVEEPIEGLDRVLRPTAVAVDDTSLTHPGTHGGSVLEPGSYAWFRGALLVRAPELGLSVRFVADSVRGGWDPASQSEAFDERIDRLTAS
jgi:hypothetical protein